MKIECIKNIHIIYLSSGADSDSSYTHPSLHHSSSARLDFTNRLLGSPVDWEARNRSTPSAHAVARAHDRSVNLYFISSPQDHGAGEVTQLFCCTNNHDDSDELPENTPSFFSPSLQIHGPIPLQKRVVCKSVLSRINLNYAFATLFRKTRNEYLRSAILFGLLSWINICMMHKDLQQLHNLHVMLFNINVSERMKLWIWCNNIISYLINRDWDTCVERQTG